VTVEARLDELVECLVAYSRHDFTVRVPVSDRLDHIDAVATGINMMAEDLEGTVASRRELEEAYGTLRDTQARLMNAGKLAAIGQLASAVAHEVNNPAGWAFAAVAVGKRRAAEVQKIVDDLGLSDRAGLKVALDEIHEVLGRASEGLARIREVALDLRTTFSGCVAPDMEPLLLDDVVRSTSNLVRPTLPDGIALRVRLGDVPPVRANRGRLAQVVTNLLANALEALDRHSEGTVELSTESDDTWAHLVVDDSGSGIPIDLTQRIFEPFFTTRERGIGLGLSLVSEILTQHGGNISVGRSPLGGARFDVRLPLAR
jgi:two-component system, NtrC family, sensor kinase